MNTSFFSEMLQSIADRSRALIGRERREPAHERSAGLVEQCEELLTGRGEASGVALAQDILARYAELTTGPRIAFFEALATTFGHDRAGIDRADYEAARWSDVLAGLLSSVADESKPLPANPVMRELEDALLAKLGPLTREGFEDLMQAPILRS